MGKQALFPACEFKNRIKGGPVIEKTRLDADMPCALLEDKIVLSSGIWLNLPIMALPEVTTTFIANGRLQNQR
jgi:hypothetical protein